MFVSVKAILRSWPFRAVVSAALSMALTYPAFAHAELEKKTAPAGGVYEAVLRVPHGCKGLPTTGLALRVPEGFLLARPHKMEDWQTEIKTGGYATPHKFAGEVISSGPVEIRWSGGSLADKQQEDFVVTGVLAEDITPGTTLYFKFVQTCPNGGEEAWIETSGSDEGSPAPALLVTAKE